MGRGSDNLEGRFYRAIELAQEVVEIRARHYVYVQQMAKLHPAMQHLLTTNRTVSYVRVDGFWSFFFDGPSVIVPDAVTGFRALGMENTANAVTKAMRLLADFLPVWERTASETFVRAAETRSASRVLGRVLRRRVN